MQILVTVNSKLLSQHYTIIRPYYCVCRHKSSIYNMTYNIGVYAVYRYLSCWKLSRNDNDNNKASLFLEENHTRSQGQREHNTLLAERYYG